MTPTPEAQELIRRYLLGQLSEGVREKFEQELLTSDDLFQELLVIEDELVDEYLAGKLNVEDGASFEQHFLVTPERHEKLNFGRAFDKYLSSRVSSDAEAINLTPARSQWGWPQSFFSSPLRLAVVAIAVLLLGFGVWRVFFYQSDVDKGLL